MKHTALFALFIILMSWPQAAFPIQVDKYSCYSILDRIRVMNGGHPIYVVNKPIPDIETRLPERLKEFGKNKPSVKNTLKKNILFNPLLVKGIRSLLTGRKEAHEVVDLFKDIKPGIKYNYVLTGDGIVIGKVEVKFKRLDDLLSKHLLLSNFHKNVRYAGEFMMDENGVIQFTNNSGTYKPDAKYIKEAEGVIREIFKDSGIPIVGTAVDQAVLEKTNKEPKKTVLGKIKTGLQRLKGLDGMYLRQEQLKKEIKASSKEKRIVQVPVSELLTIHKMDGVNEDKIERRVAALKGNQEEILKAGVLTMDLQNKWIPSDTPMSVIRDSQNRLVIFDGNGRFKSIKKAFEANPLLKVEVELFDTDSPNVVSDLEKIRRYRGFND